MRWIAEVLDSRLKRLFGRLGRFIGEHPSHFVIVPPLVFCVFATFLRDIAETTDIERLYSPRDGAAKGERTAVQQRFLEDPFLFYDPSRRTYGTRLGTVIFTAKGGQSGAGALLSREVWTDLVRTDELVRNVTIERGGHVYDYSRLCAKFFLRCLPNDILDLEEYVESGDLTFPYFTPEGSNRTFSLVGSFGSAKLDASGKVLNVPALKLAYFLGISNWEDDLRASMWEKAFMEAMDKHKPKTVDMAYFTYRTMEDEMKKNTQTVVPYFSVATFIILGFCAGTSMMRDWVRSKPLLSLQGVLSAMMATGTAFGLCVLLGVPFAGINMAAPFLMLGIGMDDTFVVISAWRRTSIKDPMPKRLSEAYADAAVSITITSLTDMLSYWVGAISPFEAVRTFCIYSGTSVAFTYLFHVTFFGGCMAFAGRQERGNQHSVTFQKVLPKSEAGGRSRAYRLFCAGGISQQYPDDPLDNQDHAVMVFFRDKFAVGLSKLYVKIAVLVVFAGYLGVGVWGITQIQEGLQRKHMVQEHSYAYEFYEADDKYFRDYPYMVMLAILEPLDYSKPEVRKQVLDFVEKAEATDYVEENKIFTQFWLRHFLQYSEEAQLDISNSALFAHELRQFLRKPEMVPYRYFLDVRFGTGDGNDTIMASRAVVQAAHMNLWTDDAILVEQLREVCREAPFDAVPFQEYFVFFDQFLRIRPVTIQNVGIAAGVMLFVSLMLIPSPVCAIWVGFAILSIEVGVVGYMALWGVNLDAVSMITVIMCIGFSVDFSAHVSYAFVSSERPDPKGKIQDALHHMGFPIIQGSLSTVLGLIPVIFAPSYVFYTFFKVTTLVMLFGAAHGLVLLPVLLSLFTPRTKPRTRATPPTAEDGDGHSMSGPTVLTDKNGGIANHGFKHELHELD